MAYQHVVIWSKNHKNKYIAISSDVKLFELTQNASPLLTQQQTNTNQQYNTKNKQYQTDYPNSKLIATGPEIPYFKAASCYPGPVSDDESLVAISCGGGPNVGKIVLVCLRPAANYSIDNSIYIDLIAKRSICNDVDWSLVNSSLLATGWDKFRVDNSLQIWDINRIIDTGKYSFHFSMSPNNRPVFETCPGDSINSLRWLRKEQSIVCGANNKQLRIFDLRDLTKPKLTTNTRAVYGLTVDTFSDKRLASYVENQILIWDTRFLEKPLVTIVESKPISQTSWCPTRNHSFSALMFGDDCVKIYDIQQASLFSDDFEAKIVDRLIHPFVTSHNSGYQQLTSYDWHANDELRMIAISNSRDVRALTICDRITLNWSPICEIVWTKGKKILQCLDSRDEKYKSLDDISVNMRHRAITNYGMIVEEGPHHQRGDDSDLIGLLRWVKLAKSLDDSSSAGAAATQIKQLHQIHHPSQQTQSKQCNEILGVGSLLRDGAYLSPSRAEVRAINWSGFQATPYLVAPVKIQVYHSGLRSRALLLCDWIPDIDNISQQIPIIDYLEQEGNYMRAASIAVFNMRLQRAIESLTIGANHNEPNLSSVAMALSGYTGERNSVWREMCQSLKSQLKDPYMKAMFAFLTSESESDFDEIIYDKDLILADRVAFSLLYLPDDRLSEYLSNTMSKLVTSGDLNGILLTGITNDGLDLLQRYIEISSDIQSVSLIILHSLPSVICNDERAQLWVECYRGMLDCWRLWHQRAIFDNLWYSNSPSFIKPPNHILISCNYCGNNIAKHQQQHSSQQLLSSTTGSTTSSTASGSTTLANQSSIGANASVPISTSTTTTIDLYSGQTVQQISSTPVQSNVSSGTTSNLSNLMTTSAPSSSLVGSGSVSNASVPSAQSNQTITLALPSQPNSNLGSSSTTTSGPGGRNKSCSNCKKCSFAKCCLCLTQLGSNVVVDQRNFHSSISTAAATNATQSASASLFSSASMMAAKMDSLNVTNKPLSGNRSQNNGSSANNHNNANKTNPFSNWFSWCQTCRHGAHSAHLLSWFNENTECPVSGCDCKCMNLDSRTKLDSVHRI